ncbi:hypothetical protein D8674_016951 [Pyrus ussuriensis x Pyrus communis]|uniref:Uncharacterized protein n=1 Tax=Pyrus ussuriensis x Pyrus communis TaxID=2448454 RepID=A0A5N5HGG3_9ROSA|nr:hypothetical protein D8674_016951 [Pyrus ussuriensis x Pyrus communis]
MNKSKGSRLLSCYDEKRHNLIRRINFAWAVESDENKKQKKSSKESAVTQWQWQSIVENIQLAHQELSKQMML